MYQSRIDHGDGPPFGKVGQVTLVMNLLISPINKAKAKPKTPNEPKQSPAANAIYQSLLSEAIVKANANDTSIKTAFNNCMLEFGNDKRDSPMPELLVEVVRLHEEWHKRYMATAAKNVERAAARTAAKRDAASLWTTALAKHEALLNETDEQRLLREEKVAKAEAKKLKKEAKVEMMKAQNEAEIKRRVKEETKKLKAAMLVPTPSASSSNGGFDESSDDEKMEEEEEEDDYD